MKVSNIDYILLFSVLILVILGAAAVYSASSYKADEDTRARLLRRAENVELSGHTELAASLRENAKTIDGTKYYMLRQVQKIVIGLLVMVIATFVDFKKWLGWSPLFYLVSLILLALLFTGLPIVVSHGEACRWLSIGGVTFQPSDFARYALILLLARFLVEYKDDLNDLKTYLIFWGVIAVVVAMVAMETDMGTAIMIALISILIFYLADVNFNYILATVTTMMTIGIFYLRIHPYMLKRIWHFMAQIVHQTEPSYQIKQSLIQLCLRRCHGCRCGEQFSKIRLFTGSL
ncbi:MAG: FtsW/RodA/SpoVE family cell cycle protein [candidate division KSB1 bacterium]|nr:FtsW/RodA/SpoVE family cell cycle protein [candidate division KSB1 bacterium]